MTNFTPRPEAELIQLHFDDRRRLAVSQAVMLLERHEMNAIAFGGVVLANVVNEDEVVAMADHATKRLNSLFGA